MEILLLDIGNTAVKIGLADRERVREIYALRTDPGQTADDFGLSLLGVLRHAGVAPDAVRACAVASVVPDFDPILRGAVARYVGCPLLAGGEELRIPLDNRYEHPAEVGADRLVGAYAARRRHPEAPSLLVVDFGTAVTFDCVEGDAYLGGLIFPGPRTALSALAREAAKLPRVSLTVSAPAPAPGRNTATSIQHGLVFGFACLVEGLVDKLRRQMAGPAVVLGTGGFAADIARVSGVFDEVLPSLLLEGLRRLYYETVRNGGDCLPQRLPGGHVRRCRQCARQGKGEGT